MRTTLAISRQICLWILEVSDVSSVPPGAYDQMVALSCLTLQGEAEVSPSPYDGKSVAEGWGGARGDFLTVAHLVSVPKGMQCWGSDDPQEKGSG